MYMKRQPRQKASISAAFWLMEQQVAMTAKRKGALRNYRETEFQRMGFSNIRLLKDEEDGASKS